MAAGRGVKENTTIFGRGDNHPQVVKDTRDTLLVTAIQDLGEGGGGGGGGGGGNRKMDKFWRISKPGFSSSNAFEYIREGGAKIKCFISSSHYANHQRNHSHVYIQCACVYNILLHAMHSSQTQ